MYARARASMRASPGHQKAQFLEFAIHELRERQIMAELILNFFFPK